MKRAFLRIGTILTVFPCCSFALAQLLPSQAKGSARAQVVMLNPAGGYAAGIIVGYDARLVYIATAAHITDLSANPPPNVQVKFEGLSQFPRPGKFWPQFEKPGAGDLAVVTIDRDDGINKFLNDLDFDLLSPVPLGPTDSPVTSIGFYGGAEWSSGAKETLLPPDQGYIRFQSDVNEGQSGGGLFNEAWELIGMPVDVGPNAVYARTIESILEDIRKWNIPVLLKVRPLKERARGADEIARLNAAVVKSQELAAKAEVQWTSSVQLASLLAVQASRTAQTDQAMVQLGRIWDHTFERTLYANDTLRAVAFSPDGTQLATGGLDGKLILWDPATGRQLRTINSGGGWVSSVAFSPDGKTVAAGSDMKVLIFDSQTGVLLATLLGHTDAVYSVAFSPDGKQLASGGGDHKVIVWDAKEAKLLRVLSGHTDVVYCVAFSPSGKLLASGSEDKSIILWNTADGSRIGTMTDQKDVVFCVAFSPDSSLLAAGYGTVYTGLGVSLLSQDKNVVIWDVLAQKRQLTLTGHTNAIAGVTFSPDGKLLVSGSSDKSLIVWDVKDGSRVQILTGHRKPIEGVAFAPSGEVIASVGDDHEVMLWDGPNGINHRTLSGHTGSVNSVAFSPDGAELASGGKNHELILWDVKKGVQLKSLRGHTASVNSVSFSADGKLLASGGGDKRIILWDARTGALLKTLDAPHNVYTVAFSPDSKQLASGGFDT